VSILNQFNHWLYISIHRFQQLSKCTELYHTISLNLSLPHSAKDFLCIEGEDPPTTNHP